jgi:phage gp45-like
MPNSHMYNTALKTAAGGAATVYLPGVNNCNFTTTIVGLSASTDTWTVTPVVAPYGFASMPDQNYTAVVGSLGIRSQAPVVLGYTNAVKSTSPLQQVAGETALYNSTNFSFEVKLTELRARFNGISCKIVNGNADQKLLSDIFNEFIDLVTYLNLQTQTIYNTHIHNLGGTAGGALLVTIPALNITSSTLTVTAPSGGGNCTISGTTTPTAITLAIPPTPSSPVCPTTPPLPIMTAYTYTNPIVTDASYIDANKLYIDDNGVMP